MNQKLIIQVLPKSPIYIVKKDISTQELVAVNINDNFRIQIIQIKKTTTKGYLGRFGGVDEKKKMFIYDILLCLFLFFLVIICNQTYIKLIYFFIKHNLVKFINFYTNINIFSFILYFPFFFTRPMLFYFYFFYLLFKIINLNCIFIYGLTIYKEIIKKLNLIYIISKYDLKFSQ